MLAIAFKLDAPKSRNLIKAARLWNQLVADKGIKDIYAGKDFVFENFEAYGSLRINHFIPWSFVMHDEVWNLVPTFKNINSRKNDKLLLFNEYIGSSCEVQYKAFSYLSEKKLDKDLESYVDGLRIEKPYRLKERRGKRNLRRS